MAEHGNELESGMRRVHDETHTSEDLPVTAHQISQDSWFQAGFVLTTGINSIYVLGYSATIMVPLGWFFGVVGLILAAAISLYANSLIAKLHEFGGKRHIRYRDLAGFVYGKKAYALTWGLQYVNLFMINTGFIILAGSALKDLVPFLGCYNWGYKCSFSVNNARAPWIFVGFNSDTTAVFVMFSENNVMTLPYCIAITGFMCALFAIAIPHLSALRFWLIVSTVLGLFYIVAAFGLSLQNGIKAPERDYNIPESSTASKVFTTIGAAANLVFAFNTGMLPEIQATVRKPVVSNMMKALYFQFTVGIIPMLAVTFIGYWAYGASTEVYLLNSVNGPLWVKAAANITAFLQTIIALHIFASPMYEYIDTKFGIKGSAMKMSNLSFRVAVRGGYLAVNTLVAALLPFLGDFMSLTGAISTFPLTFILANHMYMVAKKTKLSTAQKIWHWLNVLFFGTMSVAAAISALRLIAVDSKTFHLFADM